MGVQARGEESMEDRTMLGQSRDCSLSQEMWPEWRVGLELAQGGRADQENHLPIPRPKV